MIPVPITRPTHVVAFLRHGRLQVASVVARSRAEAIQCAIECVGGSADAGATAERYRVSELLDPTDSADAGRTARTPHA